MEKPEKDRSLDRFDKMILEILQVEGRLPIAELSRRVGLSKTPCQTRLKRLISSGYITGFRAILDQTRLQKEHVAFVEVKLQDTRESALQAFSKAALQVPELEQCHMIAGAYDFLLKIRTKDIQEFRRVLGEKLTSLPHVANTSTHVSMQAVKDLAI